jgi:hypothetical protein
MWHIFDVDQVERGFTILEIIRPYMFLSTGETFSVKPMSDFQDSTALSW